MGRGSNVLYETGARHRGAAGVISRLAEGYAQDQNPAALISYLSQGYPKTTNSQLEDLIIESCLELVTRAKDHQRALMIDDFTKDLQHCLGLLAAAGPVLQGKNRNADRAVEMLLSYWLDETFKRGSESGPLKSQFYSLMSNTAFEHRFQGMVVSKRSTRATVNHAVAEAELDGNSVAQVFTTYCQQTWRKDEVNQTPGGLATCKRCLHLCDTPKPVSSENRPEQYKRVLNETLSVAGEHLLDQMSLGTVEPKEFRNGAALMVSAFISDYFLECVTDQHTLNKKQVQELELLLSDYFAEQPNNFPLALTQALEPYPTAC